MPEFTQGSVLNSQLHAFLGSRPAPTPKLVSLPSEPLGQVLPEARDRVLVLREQPLLRQRAVRWPEVLPDDVRRAQPFSPELDVALPGGPDHLMRRIGGDAARNGWSKLDLAVELEDVAADPHVAPRDTTGSRGGPGTEDRSLRSGAPRPGSWPSSLRGSRPQGSRSRRHSGPGPHRASSA